MAQPAKRLVRTLLDLQTSMEPEFLQAEERRRQARQPTETYDITAWSVPRPFKQDGTTYSSRTLIIKVKENGSSLAPSVDRLAKASGAEYTTSSGWVDEGPNFGSHRVFYLPQTKVALAWDRPTGSGSAGATRFVLEPQYSYPVTVVTTQQLASGDLGQFQTIILPDGGFGEGYAAVLGPNAGRHLKDWVESGGTLIGLGSGALSYLADPRSGLLSISQENVVRESDARRPGAGQVWPGGFRASSSPPSRISTKRFCLTPNCRIRCTECCCGQR